MGFYLQPHRSQYAVSASAVTRSSGCTWTAGANGIAATTGGATRPTPDQVHRLVPVAMETNPATPGWSLSDLATALHRIGVPGVDRSGQGWGAVASTRASGRYLVVQGVSAAFSNETCSGSFDGDHAIGVHPRTKVDAAGVEWWWIDDPVCFTGRWERAAVLRRYAEALEPSVLFLAFAGSVPATVAVKPPDPPVTLRFHARQLNPAQGRTIRVPVGRLANVRTAPTTAAAIASHLRRGSTFSAYQVTDAGERLAGSSRWYGDRSGTRWVHGSSF